MNLTQLKYFMAVCEYGTISAAAEHLHIAQPSLSIAIKELENEFEIALFNRTHKGMQLTDDGRRFLYMSADIVERAENAERAMKDIGRGKKSLRLGVPPMIGSLVLPLIYTDFVSQSPDIDVEIIECGGEEAARLMRDGIIDMAFISHSGDLDSDMDFFRIGDLQIVCSASVGNLIIKDGVVSPKALDGVPLVMYKDGFFQSRRIKNWFEADNIEPNVLVTTNQLSTMIKLISSGTAVGFLFDKLVENEDNIECVPLEPLITLSISLVWQKSGHLFSTMKRFKSFIVECGLLK